MEIPAEYIVPYVISNTVFLLTIYLAVKKPLYARIFFILLFIGAFYVNFTTVADNPQLYVEYGKLSFLSFYKEFIYGYFAEHVIISVRAMALLQLIIAILMALDSYRVKIACFGGILFGLAIAPLGAGSAFPSTIFMTIALFILLKKYEHYYIWHFKQYSMLTKNKGNGL